MEQVAQPQGAPIKIIAKVVPRHLAELSQIREKHIGKGACDIERECELIAGANSRVPLPSYVSLTAAAIRCAHFMYAA